MREKTRWNLNTYMSMTRKRKKRSSSVADSNIRKQTNKQIRKDGLPSSSKRRTYSTQSTYQGWGRSTSQAMDGTTEIELGSNQFQTKQPNKNKCQRSTCYFWGSKSKNDSQQGEVLIDVLGKPAESWGNKEHSKWKKTVMWCFQLSNTCRQA